MPWRTSLIVAIAVLPALNIPAPRAAAEEDAQQLRQAYDDTLAQLRDAQQRKTQLAAENEQLKAKVAELEKQVSAADAKAAELRRRNEQLSQTESYLHSHYAAFQQFLHRYPQLQMRWKTFLQSDLHSQPSRGEPPILVDPEWPLSAQA
jgi:septal ring factor EnvC (AmiA/AmiB activator)